MSECQVLLFFRKVWDLVRSKESTQGYRIPPGYGSGPSIPGYNRRMRMRWGWSAVVFAAFAVGAVAADEPRNPGVLVCPQVPASDPACNPSKADLKKSKAAFSKALKFQKEEHFDEAFEEFDTAA